MTQSLFFVAEDNGNIHIMITIELWLPTSQNRSFSTDISVTQLSGDVTIEGYSDGAATLYLDIIGDITLHGQLIPHPPLESDLP